MGVRSFIAVFWVVWLCCRLKTTQGKKETAFAASGGRTVVDDVYIFPVYKKIIVLSIIFLFVYIAADFAVRNIYIENNNMQNAIVYLRFFPTYIET